MTAEVETRNVSTVYEIYLPLFSEAIVSKEKKLFFFFNSFLNALLQRNKWNFVRKKYKHDLTDQNHLLNVIF